MKFDFYKRLIYLLNLVKKRKKHIISYLIACLFIYIGLWTTAWQDIPEKVDESAWLRRSIRAEATFYKIYPEVFEFNYSSLNQLTTSGYIIGLGRWLQGIPAEAVKRYTHAGNIDPDIRASMLRFCTGLSSLSLLIFFFWLHRIYGLIAAISTIALMMLSPFWQNTLRRIMAEPFLFLFYVLAFGTTIWMVELLFNQKSLWMILTVTTLNGVWIGLAGGVKFNGFILLVGFTTVMISLPWRTYSHYFLLIWLGSLTFLSTIFNFVLTNPFFWHDDIIERVQSIITFRNGTTAGATQRQSESHLVDVMASFVASLMNSLNLNNYYSDYFNVLPGLISLLLCLVGGWYGFKIKDRLAYRSHMWFLSIASVNALIIPLNWDRYFIFIVLTVHVFIGVGISCVIGFINKNSLNTTRPSQKIKSYRFSMYQKSSGIFSILLVVIIIGILFNSTIQLIPTRNLWKQIIFAKNTAHRLQLMNDLIIVDPQTRVFNTGGFLLDTAKHHFSIYSKSHDPSILGAIHHTGKLLLTHSQDNDLQARVKHDMQFMDRQFKSLINKNKTQYCYDLNKQPVVQVDPTGSSVQLTEKGHILLQSKSISASTVITTYQHSNYQFRINSHIQLPIHVTFGLFLDNQKISSFSYQIDQINWYNPNFIIPLDKGEHKLSVQLLNVSDEAISHDNTSTLWTAHFYPVELPFCTIGQLPITLPSWYQTDLAIDFFTPIPALYDIELTYPQPVTQPLQVFIDTKPISLRLEQLTNSQVITLPPIYLNTGNHSLTITTSYSTTWQQLKLFPHFSSENEAIPSEFDAPQPQFVLLTKSTNISHTWKWFENHTPYNFYTIRIFGSSKSFSPTKVAVSINNNFIGITELNSDGISAKPLLEELANGGTHTISITPVDMMEKSEAYLYAVQIEKYDNILIFAGSSMRWNKQYNHRIETDNSVIHLPPDITLSKNMMIDSEGVYSVTVRYRVKTSMDPNSQLHFNIGGWPIGQIATPETPDWQDYTFTTYLTTGDHDFQLWWENMSGHELIDVMYVIAEKNAL